ncbi:MAG: carboxypeptidase regulatory-like domain-containing protein [Sphingobacteriales bacterium]|nr:MAG: carboxypeptidase regulatory-like domain-containing protein [Sphingobacteriales bacterium]
MRSLILGWLLLFASISASAQTQLLGRVLNAWNQAPIAGALVNADSLHVTVLTDSAGQFRLSVPENAESLTVRVKALGVDTTYTLFPQSSMLAELWVTPRNIELATAIISGKTARQVVQQAIRAIPKNYPDSNYVCYGFYRQYQKSETGFQNLVEAQIAAAVFPEPTRKGLQASQLFAVLRSKRFGIKPTQIGDVEIRDGLSEQLFEENPVYFPGNSSFAGRLFDISRFRFDSSYSGTDEYRILYTCDLSSEDHGFNQKFATSSSYNESTESGMLIIDRTTLAFKRIQRTAVRRPNFSYYYMQNYVRAPGKLSRELVNGQLDVQYIQRGTKWFLLQISHGYFNDYYSHPDRTYGNLSPFAQSKGRLGEFFEWHTASIARGLPEPLVPALTPRPCVQLQPDVVSGWKLDEEHSFPFLAFPEATVTASFPERSVK